MREFQNIEINGVFFQTIEQHVCSGVDNNNPPYIDSKGSLVNPNWDHVSSGLIPLEILFSCKIGDCKKLRSCLGSFLITYDIIYFNKYKIHNAVIVSKKLDNGIFTILFRSRKMSQMELSDIRSRIIDTILV